MMEIPSGPSPRTAPPPLNLPAMRPDRLLLALLFGALTCLAAEPVKKPAPREGRKTKTYRNF